MNFKKLSKEKKNQLVLVGLVTLVLLVGLGYGLIRFQLAYVQALDELSEDDERREDLIQRGWARARQFTWQKTAEQTAAVYKGLLGRT